MERRVDLKLHCITASLLALSVLCVFYQSIDYPLLNWDDPDYVVENTAIRSLTFENLRRVFAEPRAANYVPLTTLSFGLNYWLDGLNPRGYRLLNLSLHLANTFWIYWILGRLVRGWLPPLIGSLLFAIHPLNVESVAWVSERKNLLSLFFFLAAFLTYCAFRESHSRRNRWSTWIASFVSFCLACLAKSAAVVLPILFLLYEASRETRIPKRRASSPGVFSPLRVAFLTLPYWVFGATISWLNIRAQSDAGAIYEFHGGSPWVTFFTMVKVFALYLGRFILPAELNNRYPNYTVPSVLTTTAVASLAVLGILGLLVFLSWRRRRVLLFGLGWFFVALLPVSNLVPISTIMADRYVYFPFLGLAFLVASGIEILGESKLPVPFFDRRLLHLAVSVILVGYGAAAHSRVQVWRSDIALWQDSLAKDPRNDLAHNNLALAYREAGRNEEALTHFRAAVSQNPENFEARVNLGEMLASRGGYGEAEVHLRRALSLKPNDHRAENNLASVLISLGRLDEGIASYRRAISIDPNRAATYYNLANALVSASRSAEAELEYKRSLSLDPGLAVSWLNLGNLHLAENRFPAALEAYERARSLEPSEPSISLSLGALYLKRGEAEKAAAQFERVLELDPAESGAHLNLAQAWELLGRTGAAAASYRQFLGSAPAADPSRDFAQRRLIELQRAARRPSRRGEGRP